MAKCFDVVGYIEPCNAVRQKYTGRALLITDDEGTSISFTFSDNGLNVTSIGLMQDFNNDSHLGEFAVTIDAENPFGVTVQGNTDSGRVSYIKTIPVSIPATRDGKAEEFIMGLQKALVPNMVIILETLGDLTKNDMFGAYSPVYIDPASVTRSEYENGGAWQFNLVCEEPVPNVICTIPHLRDKLDKLNA